MFAGHVPLDSQSPSPIIVYFLANFRDMSRNARIGENGRDGN